MATSLVLLNGAPGSGKSTLARLLVDARPRALLLDVDTVRGFLGAWEGDPHSAGLAARKLALAMARTHLATADVVVPQFVARPEFVEQLRAAASEAGARFVHVALVSSPEEAAARFAARAGSSDPNHRDAAALQAAPGAVPVDHLYRRLMTLLATYDDVRYVESAPGDILGTLAALEAALTRA